eukprot:Seg1429.3 transcript_id=Seg1429.3/GoldUCD/mRNA.D3Y31 product="hypothetical protein" protein_id=Seg1429.3/GoldUCD/D3Y31
MDREKVLNEGFCTIYKDDSRQGFGAFVDITSQKKKFGTKCACIVPDNVIKLNEFLCSKGQSKKYTGEITILETGPIHAPKRFDIVKLLYYDTTLGICCFKVNVKKKLKRYSRTFYRDGVTGTDHKNIFAFKRSAEELILENFGQQKEDILPVLITENEKDGLEKDGKGSYPVFMKMRHYAAYFYQLIGFLALRKGTECDLLLCTNLKKALSCKETSFEGQSLFDRFMEDRKKEHQQPNNDEKQDQGAQAEEKQPEKKTSAENGDEQGRGEDLPLANEPAGPKEKVNIPLEEEENAAYLEQERAEGLGNQQESRRNTVQEDVGQRLNLQEQHFVGGLENQQDYTEIQSSQERPGQQQNTQDQPSGVGLENQQESRRETVKEPQRPEDLEARHGQQQDRVVQGGDGGKHIDDRNVELSLPKQPDKQYPSVQEILAVKECVHCDREADIPLSEVEHIFLKFNNLKRLLNKGDCDKIYHYLFDDRALYTGINDTEGLLDLLQVYSSDPSREKEREIKRENKNKKERRGTPPLCFRDGSEECPRSRLGASPTTDESLT